MSEVRQLVDTLATQLAALVERQAIELARAAVEGALGGRRPGRPSSSSLLLGPSKPRKKGPTQFCPVPGCTNPAAPLFGMVCSEHKAVSKAKIKQYREARRAAKVAEAAEPAPRKGRKAKARKPRRPVPGKKAKVAKKKPAAEAARKKLVARRKTTKKAAREPAAVKIASVAASPAPPPPAAAA
ncbi:MAG TPA: hypothetical protein VHG72_00935 [Polyangia bacterium]|nr:hypothetical protein [Polyangia bacterium]